MVILKAVGAGAAAVMLAGGAYVWAHGRGGRADDPVPPPAVATSTADAPAGSVTAADPAPPQASDRTREEKRFDRYDHDRDGKVTRDEYLAARRKAFARLDTNGDGQLSFDEWAAKSEGKFAAADADHSGTLTRAEFATTRVLRKPSARRPASCPPPNADGGDDG